MSALSPALRAAYRGSAYRVLGVELRVGRRRQEALGLLRGLGLRRAFLVTAYNPCSKKLPEALNRRAQARLLASLGSMAVAQGESGAGRWQEGQILVRGERGRVQTMLRRYRQNAILSLKLNQAPALVVLR